MSTEMTRLEAALAQLRPTTGSLTREGLLFAAGRASAQRAVVFWRRLAGAALAGAAMLAGAWWAWPARVVERVITLQVASPPAAEQITTPTPESPATTPTTPSCPTPPTSEPVIPTPSWTLGPHTPQLLLEREQQQAWQFRQQVLRFGVESLALPQWTGSTHFGPPRTLLQLMNEIVLPSANFTDQENR